MWNNLPDSFGASLLSFAHTVVNLGFYALLLTAVVLLVDVGFRPIVKAGRHLARQYSRPVTVLDLVLFVLVWTLLGLLR
jgi:hypothetical protein